MSKGPRYHGIAVKKCETGCWPVIMYRSRYVKANGLLDWPMMMMGMGDDIQVTSHFVVGTFARWRVGIGE